MPDEQTDSFDLTERAEGDRAWIALHGELDLDGLTFMDSTGIRLVLESLRHREREGWGFEVTRGSTAVQRIFAAARIDDRLPYATKDG